MAVFDTNLMLRNTTQTVGTLLSLAAYNGAPFTSDWLTLGTNVAGPVTLRTTIQTAVSNTDTMDLHFELSDDQTFIDEEVIERVTGTEFVGTLAGSIYPQRGDIQTPIFARHKYIRVRGIAKGYNVNFGVVTIGVDAGGLNPKR